MTSVLNFIKIASLVQMLGLLEGGSWTNKQNVDLISLSFLFKESRLTKNNQPTNSHIKNHKIPVHTLANLKLPILSSTYI
jgi:hypothetical protein